MDVKLLCWTEKYRPTKLDELVGDHVEKIKSYIQNPQNMPNLLFVSRSPGTGKSSTCRIIVRELKAEAMFLNASDERGIEVIRGKIKNFAKSISFNGNRKVVILDEADNLTKDSMMSLRALMEEFSSNVVFFLTCNFETKIILPIQSRCVKIDLSKPNREQSVKYLERICKEEKIEYTLPVIEELLNVYYPSLRDCVNFLQDLKNLNKPLTSENVVKEGDGTKLLELLKKKDYEEIRRQIFVGDLDVMHANQFLWRHINLVEMPTEKKIKLIQILANNERDFAFGVDNNIVFVSRVPELIKVME